MPDKPANEREKWEALMRSIRKGAHILGRTLTERDMPDYLNWYVATDMNKRIWAEVHSKSQKKEVNNPMKKGCRELADNLFKELLDKVIKCECGIKLTGNKKVMDASQEELTALKRKIEGK